MSVAVDQVFETPQGKYLVDPYDDWARAEGAPIHRGAAIDLVSLDTRPWPRFGVNGAICHLDGHDDFLALFVFDLAPGASSAPARHLYEEIFYGLSGRGIAEIDLPGGETTTMEWGPQTLFSAPMNARVRLRNTSPSRARVASINDIRYLMSLYRNERFLFDTPMEFPERASGHYARDCATGAAGAISLANGSIGADLFDIASGEYARAERQMFGSLLLGVAGDGMTLSWEDDAEAASRTKWRHGVACSPAGMTFHQHFNIGSSPARYLRMELGGVASPMFRPRRKAYGDTSVYAAGDATIEPRDQSPAIETMWREAKTEK